MRGKKWLKDYRYIIKDKQTEETAKQPARNRGQKTSCNLHVL
jgi:hypothetical protein